MTAHTCFESTLDVTSVVVETERLAALAQATTRSEFVAKVAASFLVLEQEIFDQEQVGFSTRILDPAAARRAAQRGAPSNLEVLPIAKNPANPYPDRVSVGRARNCDVVMRDPSVSKLHAHFRIGGPKLELVDIDSQNGTRVNGKQIPAHQPVAVSMGDSIWFGTVTCRLVDAAALYDLLK